jgi:hypothetical protein
MKESTLVLRARAPPNERAHRRGALPFLHGTRARRSTRAVSSHSHLSRARRAPHGRGPRAPALAHVALAGAAQATAPADRVEPAQADAAHRPEPRLGVRLRLRRLRGWQAAQVPHCRRRVDARMPRPRRRREHPLSPRRRGAGPPRERSPDATPSGRSSTRSVRRPVVFSPPSSSGTGNMTCCLTPTASQTSSWAPTPARGPQSGCVKTKSRWHPQRDSLFGVRSPGLAGRSTPKTEDR